MPNATDLDDNLIGTSGSELLMGGIGNDTLDGGAGFDLVWGEDGNDFLYGGSGDDFLEGGFGNDYLNGDDGSDSASYEGPRINFTITKTATGFTVTDNVGLEGRDTLVNVESISFHDSFVELTGATEFDDIFGQDFLAGGTGDDNLSGSALNDILEGGAGNDILYGGAGNDSLYGGAGNDSLYFLVGNDYLDGGDGHDMLSWHSYASSETIAFGNAILIGGNGRDYLSGWHGNDVLQGGNGGDDLSGAGGNDTIDGGSGTDVVSLRGPQSAYTVTKTATGYVVEGTETTTVGGTMQFVVDDGTDTLTNIEWLQFADGILQLSSAADGDRGETYDGDAAFNFMRGGFGDDILNGYGGNDTIDGGIGSDSIDGGAGEDTVIVNGRQGNYTVTKTATGYTITDNVGSEGSDTLFNVEWIKFQPPTLTLADLEHPLYKPQYLELETIPYLGQNVGDSVTNTQFDSIDGNNILTGTAGNDILDGGTGIDTVILAGMRSSFTLSGTTEFSVTDSTGAQGIDTLRNIERIVFNDTALAFDTDGNAGKAYRIYQAAFDRAPDLEGLGYWIDILDQGYDFYVVADSFFTSDEFKSLYGSNPSNTDLITRFYQNVLHRTPDQSGFDYWVNVLDTKLASPIQVLVEFSESVENKAQVVGVVQNGIEYTPYG